MTGDASYSVEGLVTNDGLRYSEEKIVQSLVPLPYSCTLPEVVLRTRVGRREVRGYTFGCLRRCSEDVVGLVLFLQVFGSYTNTWATEVFGSTGVNMFHMPCTSGEGRKESDRSHCHGRSTRPRSAEETFRLLTTEVRHFVCLFCPD